jgi:hypothetical protein
MMYDPNQPLCNSDKPIMDDEEEDPQNQYSSTLAASPSGTFGSKVVLKDIVTIQTCYINDRCTGLAFTLATGMVEILGQCTGQGCR